MYERILVALDESEVAERVLSAAKELAMISGAEVWVMHVWEAQPARYKATDATSCEQANLMVNAAAEKLASVGVTVHAMVVPNLYDYAASEITCFAKANDIGVIVMGSRGRTDFTGMLTGSTARKVLHHADRPVVVVR